MYNQTIRRQLCDYTGSLQSFVHNEKEDLLSRYQALFDWSNIFGEKNVSIVPFEKQQLTKNNLIIDFLERINIDSNIFSSYTPPHVNKSTSNESLYLIRAINSNQGISYQDRLKLTRQIIEWDRNRAEKNKSQLSLITASELESLRIYSQETQNKIAKQLLKRDNGQLFINPITLVETKSRDGELIAVTKTAQAFYQHLLSLHSNNQSKKRNCSKINKIISKLINMRPKII